MNNKELSEFLFNIHDNNSFITGGDTRENSLYCPVNCKFCICKGDAPQVGYAIPFITEEELEMGMRFVDLESEVIYLGDGISKLSAEAFAHPKIYDFLTKISQRFKNQKITIMTTGVLIRQDKIDFLNSLENVEISLSINTIQEEERKKIMSSPRTEHIKLLYKELERVGFQMFDMGSLDILEKDLMELSNIKKFEGFQLRRIEHTKYHLDEVIELSKKSIANYPRSIEYICNAFPKATYWTPSLELDYRQTGRYACVHDVINLAESRGIGKRRLFCAAESSYNFYKEAIEKANVNIIVKKIPNITYGGSVTTAGLLTFYDIEEVIKHEKNYKEIIIPKVMLNRSGEDLFGVNVEEFGRKMKKFVWVS